MIYIKKTSEWGKLQWGQIYGTVRRIFYHLPFGSLNNSIFYTNACFMFLVEENLLASFDTHLQDRRELQSYLISFNLSPHFQRGPNILDCTYWLKWSMFASLWALHCLCRVGGVAWVLCRYCLVWALHTAQPRKAVTVRLALVDPSCCQHQHLLEAVLATGSEVATGRGLM